MVGPTRTTTFNEDWLQVERFSGWLKAVPNTPRSAQCIWCKSKFSLSNMGKRALISHTESKKRTNIFKARNKSHDMAALLSPKLRSHIPAIEVPSTSQGLSTDNPLIEKTTGVAVKDGSKLVVPQSNRRITSFLVAEDVTRAEILWCLHTVETHNSLRSAAQSVALFQIMFPDSQIAAKMQLQRTKLGYLLVHGLAPYFHNELLKECRDCTDIVVGFDESLNKVAQLGQMDIVIRFWREQNNQVTSRYLTSAFLNHASAADLLRAFTSALSEVNIKRLLQVSMDGPNVNLKFHRELRDSLVSNSDDPLLLEIGSCGLHTMNCAFKAGVKATSWGISEFLRALYIILKDTPARRGDYTHYSGSKLFPKKFCSVRWLENNLVAERAVEILPHVKKYIAQILINKKATPDSKSFKTVQSMLKDPLLICKLRFFQSVAAEVESFLTEFQSSKPMAPLLFESLLQVMNNIMKRFVKVDCLTAGKYLLEIDVSDKKNLLDAKHINLGYATSESIRKVRSEISDRDILVFRQECRKCLQKIIEKLQIRSPLKFQLTKGISCLDPAVAVLPTTRDTRLDLTLKILVENRQISGTTADKVYRQFKSTCATESFQQAMRHFSRKDGRLDDLWMSVIEEENATKELRLFLKKILILSHGNADLERGFSVNRECVIENQKEESLVAQRQVYDAITVAGGVLTQTVTKSMIHAARNARARYQEAMDRQIKQNTESDRANVEKKAIALHLKELEDKKRELNANVEKENAYLNDQIASLQKKIH